MSINVERIFLELNSTCNYKCGFCPHPTMQRSKKNMPMQLALDALKQIKESGIGDYIYHYYLGEPLLSPILFDVVKEANAMGFFNNIVTNGSLLNEKNIEKISKANFNSIKVSYHTPDEESFKVRGADYYSTEKVFENIVALVKALNNSETEIGIVLMVTPPNNPCGIEGIEIIKSKGHLDNVIKEITEKLREVVDVKSLDKIQKQLDESYENEFGDYVWINDTVFIEVRPVMNWGDVFSKKKLYPKKRGYCNKALNEDLGILVNGDVVLCCMDPEGETAVGNIQTKHLKDILASEEVMKIMDNFDNGILTLKKCQMCKGTPSKLHSIADNGLYQLAKIVSK